MAEPGVDSYDHLFKLLLVGDAGVGKSRFVSIEISFIDMCIAWQHAPSLYRRHVLKASSWVRGSYFLESTFPYLSHEVYDVARRDTFANLDTWLQEVEVYSPANGRDVVKLLVGNKIDKERVVSRREGEAWARSKGMLFVESSAKTKTGIQQVFNEVVQKVCTLGRSHLLCMPPCLMLDRRFLTTLRSFPTQRPRAASQSSTWQTRDQPLPPVAANGSIRTSWKKNAPAMELGWRAL
ncbi:hypothetical protein DYB32_006947 [Aphanomyces invadans]|uniref:Uncharacterized protein n=1 Tax=Aphanomyces invadans TaxID=157072 RepID=A0A418APY8_9STRA|nr:hypothetical protein DYB32_006947 [Aphanomyces invadans]